LRIEFYALPPSEHDVAVVEIVSPVGSFLNLFDIVPSAVIRNRGAGAESAVSVSCVIEGDAAGVVYTETVVVALDSGAVDTVEFPAWSDAVPDSYTVAFAVSVPGDSIPENDVLSSRFEVLGHPGFGGPDDYGYVWYDNLYPGPEAPEFVPIDTTGLTPVDLFGDDQDTALALPFGFPFYGETFDSVWITTNGVISFNYVDGAAWSNTSLPTTSFDGAVAVFWDDLYMFDTLSQLFVGTDTVDGTVRFRIVYYNVVIRTTAYYFTAEIDLYDNGDIKFEYADFSDIFADRLAGSSATVGISAPDSSTGLEYVYNGDPPYNPVLEDMAIYFVYPGEFVDTIPPEISTTADTIQWICGRLGGVLMNADATDYSGVAACSLYYSHDGISFDGISYIPEYSSGGFYLFSVPGFSDGDEMYYYFAAVDSAGNRAVFPPDAPDSVLFAVVGDLPHSGGSPEYVQYWDMLASDEAPVEFSFNWVEIDPDEGGAGTVLDSVDDDWLSGVISIPPWCGYDAIKICSNGWITFDTTTGYAEYSTVFGSSEEPNYFVAPLFADLTPSSGDSLLPTGKIIYYSTPGGSLIVEWKNMYTFGETDSPNTFELIVWETSTGVFAVFNYLTVDPEAVADCSGIGIEGPFGSTDTSYSYLTYFSPDESEYPFGCYPYDSFAVMFYSPREAVNEKLPVYVSLGQIRPNPFNSAMEFPLELDRSAEVVVEVFTCDGRKVATLTDGVLTPGRHTIRWDADVPSGVYFVKIRVGDSAVVRKAVLVR
ncbi:T9SS type A sorting domain-containing protein, partial [bacterium]|nr:T9SS type A sorting domain-containing protein [bacterium]